MQGGFQNHLHALYGLPGGFIQLVTAPITGGSSGFGGGDYKVRGRKSFEQILIPRLGKRKRKRKKSNKQQPEIKLNTLAEEIKSFKEPKWHLKPELLVEKPEPVTEPIVFEQPVFDPDDFKMFLPPAIDGLRISARPLPKPLVADTTDKTRKNLSLLGFLEPDFSKTDEQFMASSVISGNIPTRAKVLSEEEMLEMLGYIEPEVAQTVKQKLVAVALSDKKPRK